MPDDQPKPDASIDIADPSRAPDSVAFDDSGGRAEPERLFNEANLLRLEGRLFCFDPKEAGRRRDAPRTYEETIRLEEVVKRPLIIRPDPAFGHPSVLAYKVLQAISKKLTEEGFPAPTTVSFSQRELGRLVGRSSFGGNQSRQLYRAIMQLHTTRVQCSLYDKKTEQWSTASFYVLYEALFSGKRNNLNACVVSVHPRIVESLNNKHYACINWNRLMALEPIGMALYKRLFYHFSNLYHPRRSRDGLRFEKAYEDICGEWLGGLRPERYRSKIIQTQLGRHLEALKATRLIRRYEIARRAEGEGFKLVVWPGTGFFDDYDEFYVRQWMPQLRFAQVAAFRGIQQPLELVAYFHRLLGHSHRTFEEKETAYATRLLDSYSVEEVRDLIEYAVREAETTRFKMQLLMAIKTYVGRWEVDKGHRATAQKRRGQIAACPFCDAAGYALFEDSTGKIMVHPCPHDHVLIAAIESAKACRRVPPSCG
jgi:hypothetical protein